MPDEPLIQSLQAALDGRPDDVPLRRHLALLLSRGDAPACALPHVTALLAIDPADQEALDVLASVTRRLAGASSADGSPNRGGDPGDSFDWSAAEAEVGALVEPAFVGDLGPEPEPAGEELERSSLRLSDVGGMQAVKDRLEAAFLAPMRNPELRALYGKSLRGGLMLYGPPGCGKTFLARAVAGELGAGFYAVSLADVLDMYIGQSERNLARVFDTVRRNTPCVLFLDEIDAIGQKRSHLRGSAMRGTVNQLLTELDGVAEDNEGVFVLAATNSPWDVDAALRRPGRFDRSLLVAPPDGPAREAVLHYHLRDRPLSGVRLSRLVKATEGFSGADLAHLCDSAAESALLASSRSGVVRMMEQADFDAALKDIRPSTTSWLQSARNVALFGNASGDYDELARYLKQRKLL